MQAHPLGTRKGFSDHFSWHSLQGNYTESNLLSYLKCTWVSRHSKLYVNIGMESPSLHSFWVISICAFGWETISEIGEGLKMWIYILSVPNIYFKMWLLFLWGFWYFDVLCGRVELYWWNISWLIKKSQLVVFPIFFSHWSSGVSTSAW